MSIHFARQDADLRVRIDEELNIYCAAALREALLAEPCPDGRRLFDLADVGEMDSAGLQVLLAALRPAGAIESASEAVRDCLRLCGLAALLPPDPGTQTNNTPDPNSPHDAASNAAAPAGEH